MTNVGRVELSFKPQGPVQEAYYLDESRITIIIGPLGSGKTNTSVFKLMRKVIAQAPDKEGIRPSQWIVVRNTYGELLGTTAKDYLEAFSPLGHFKQGGREPPVHELRFRLPDGTRVESNIIFMALDRPDHIRKLRGLPITGGYLSEAKELLRAIVDMVDARAGRYPHAHRVDPTWRGIIGDTNAPDTDHWLYKMAEENTPANDWKFYKQPGGLMRAPYPDEHGRPIWISNPLAENVQNLDGREQYYLRIKQGKSDDFIAVNLANEYGFVSDGKAVYPEYVDSLHCREFELDPNGLVDVGLDFGLTPAATIGQVTTTGRWRVRHELVTDHMSILTFGKDLHRFLMDKYPNARFRITGDPSGNQQQPGDEETRTVFQLLQSVKVDCTPAPGNNDWTLRRESVANLLRTITDGVPAYLIHPECKVLRKAMAGGYTLQRIQAAGTERYRDAPLKDSYSHVAESAQYMALGGGEGKAVIGKGRRPGDIRPAGPVTALGLETYLD